MLAVLALPGLAILCGNVDKTTLQFYQQTFIARKAGSVWRAPIAPVVPALTTSVVFRREDTFAVWDERGLSVRTGKHLYTSHLRDIAVSPRAFAKAEILHTVDLIKLGKRSREATALSGARRIGRNVYFLVRWDEKVSEGVTQPWAEALVRVDLGVANPEPIFVGRFHGRSLATKPIEDRLIVLNGKLAILGRNGKSWGLDTYDPATGRFSTDRLGDTLTSFALDSDRSGVYVEQSPYGTTRAGAVDLIEELSQCYSESSGFVRFLDAKRPTILVERRASETVAVNAETGAVVRVADAPGFARMGPYILVWSPVANPSNAILYDPERWEKVSTWSTP